MSNHKKGTITRLAEAAGMSAADYVASVVNAHGTVAGAAAALDVTSRTIYYHLRGAGLKTRNRVDLVRSR